MFWVSSTFQMLTFQNKGHNVGGRPLDALTDSWLYQTLTPFPSNRYFMIGPFYHVMAIMMVEIWD